MKDRGADQRPLRIVVIAGEASGDQLGTGLLRELARQGPIEVAGVGGPGLQEAGLVSWADQERLAVMGLFEVLRHLPGLLRLRRDLYRRIMDWQPDLFLGIDSPDFNLPLARRLRAAGMTTAHYVSPSVWAWRQGRVKSIRQSVDLMLTLFPFESEFYRQHGVPEACVGHPMARRLAYPVEPGVRRAKLGLAEVAPEGTPLLGLLPGSRNGEVARLLPGFLQAARLLKDEIPDLQVVIPAAGKARQAQIAEQLDPAESAWVHLLSGQSHDAMAASDALLVASGTATLEAALLCTPMVVAYRFNALTYLIGRKLVKTPWVALPNVLAQESVVPELIQNDFTPEAAVDRLRPLLGSSEQRTEMVAQLGRIHAELDRPSDALAAQALRELTDHA